MINIKKFFKENDIEFKSEKKALRWVRSIKPKTLVRIGSSYFIEEDEIKELIQSYFSQQIALKKKRSNQAKKNLNQKKDKKKGFTDLESL